MDKKNNGSLSSIKTTSKPYPIVAIGASAGGIEAVTQLFKNLRPDTGMAYVYIQHLDPHHESMLSSILSKATAMKVMQAEHLVRIEPNHLFVIPPDKNMSIVDGVITLNDRQPRPHINMPIDQFFVSLAEKQHTGAIGIILSGTANDGTLGLKAIKAAGGLTFAQDDSAKFQSMPKSAIAEGVVDLVLPPAEIAGELERLSKQFDLIIKTISLPDTDDDVLEQEKDIIPDDDENLISIIQLLKKTSGVDFLHYKRTTIKRRILRRMLLNKSADLSEYIKLLKQNTTEPRLLYHDLLIHVTSFFRDADSLEYFRKTILPQIVKTKSPKEPIRVWVPACATGEEAYSIAITMVEALGEKTDPSLQIFGTDLSEQAIAKARLGLYSKSELADVSEERLQRFFLKVDGSYRIQKFIRDLCIFAPQNLFKDPPFSRLDVVSCCNLMIYLDAVFQKKAMAAFYYALKQTGYLILGKSETIGASGQLFVQMEKKFKVFSKKQDVKAKPGMDIPLQLGDREGSKFVTSTTNQKAAPYIPELEKLVDGVLLSKYTPPSIVVNGDLEILQFRGSTGLFLEASPGKASFNLIKMARPGLAFELRNTIHKANKLNSAVRKTGLEVKIKNETHQVAIEAVPLHSVGEEKLVLVVFEEILPSETGDSKTLVSKDEIVKKLHEELNTVREDMRSIIEDHEAGTEELQSANEEIISSNEELQSINEELETSKEEIESANEELMTINTELQVRNEELSEAYEYAEALLETIREAVIVLGKDLLVKMANKAFYKIFQVKEKDTEGTPLYELGNGQWDVLKLRQLLDDVINKNAEFNGFEIQHNFPHIGEKVMLLNAKKVTQKTQRQEVILLAIEDITEHIRTQKNY